MNWKLKAAIQNAVANLPGGLSNAAYYRLQRHLGGLKNLDPTSRLKVGAATWKQIIRHGRDPHGKTFLEIGTGWVPIVPIAFWLMGAEKTITIDLNRYMRDEAVRDSLEHISQNWSTVEDLFGQLLDPKRFAKLVALVDDKNYSIPALLELCRIDYSAPADASDTALETRSVDFHTSYTVFEHIRPHDLRSILVEGIRVIRDDGLFVHRIDYGDHFSYGDPSISVINFLQFSDDEWNRFAGNRFMYANRLRHDDFIDLFKSAGHRIVEVAPYKDRKLEEALAAGSFALDEKFSTKTVDVLATTGACFISCLPETEL